MRYFSLLVLLFLCLLCPTETMATDKTVFCNVGQGDASYIHSSGMDILIDAGPDGSVLQCLSRYMKRFDSDIELVILSHADADHFIGLLDVIKHYMIKSIVLPEIGNTDKQYQKLLSSLEKNGTRILKLEAGDTIVLPHSTLSFIFPTAQDIKRCLPNGRNPCSYIFYFDTGTVSMLFTGDTSAESYTSLYDEKLRVVDVLKIPHHGSKNGLTKRLVEVTDPVINVASLGEGNQYGHPHQEVITILGQRKILRTDIDGNIVLKLSD